MIIFRLFTGEPYTTPARLRRYSSPLVRRKVKHAACTTNEAVLVLSYVWFTLLLRTPTYLNGSRIDTEAFEMA